jgi:hypothetical protein
MCFTVCYYGDKTKEGGLVGTSSTRERDEKTLREETTWET